MDTQDLEFKFVAKRVESRRVIVKEGKTMEDY